MATDDFKAPSLRKAATLALDALMYENEGEVQAALKALRAALALPEQPATAWRIEYTNADGNKRRRLFGHNAVADYRAIDPGATSTPLFDGPTC